MNPLEKLKLAPRDWLGELLESSPGSGFELDAFEVIEAADIPERQRRLLVHDDHMTVTLEKAHGAPVHLHVLEVLHADPEYSRRLYLTAGEDGPVVMAGIMKIWLQHMGSDAVREAIVGGKTPLGRILIDHGVLRKLKSCAFLRIRIDDSLRETLSVPPSAPEVTYGRLALIFCHGEPAVELLEIVAP